MVPVAVPNSPSVNRWRVGPLAVQMAAGFRLIFSRASGAVDRLGELVVHTGSLFLFKPRAAS